MDSIKDIVKAFGLKGRHIYNIYRYGSRVYGTASEKSDHDFIVIGESSVPKEEISSLDGKHNLTFYAKEEFQAQLDEHEISALECIFLTPDHIILEEIKFTTKLNLAKLRHAISAKSSNSWVKAKKKFSVPKDFNPYIAKKSLFHTIRILSYGIQIATFRAIIHYDEVNYFWQEIENNPSVSWEDYRSKYQDFYNKMCSKFREVAAKQ